MKLKILLSLTIVMCMTLGSYGGIFPSDIKKCKMGDNMCIQNKIMELFRKYPNGNPEFGLASVSALTLKNVTVSRATGNSPIQLNFRFNELVAHGLENCKITHVSGWDEEVKILDGEVIIPVLKIVGDYETNGKILFLNLDGSGKGEIELNDCLVKVKGKAHMEKRNGKTYVKITKLKAIMEPKRMFVKMDNLVNGNKELSNTINTVINDNWSDVWNELQEGINNAIAQILYNLMFDVLNDFPYEDFFDDSSS